MVSEKRGKETVIKGKRKGEGKETMGHGKRTRGRQADRLEERVKGRKRKGD
jgi:hypothetical protein